MELTFSLKYFHQHLAETCYTLFTICIVYNIYVYVGLHCNRRISDIILGHVKVLKKL